MEADVRRGFLEGAEALTRFADSASAEVVALARRIVGALEQGGKLLCCGNGGSAADAQHLAAEFVNRFRLERPALAAIALTTDTSALTAIANDYSFEQVFARQVRALARPGDVLLGITTSGTSRNVLQALEAGRELGCLCVGLTGAGGLGLGAHCDHLVVAPATATPRIQECHVAWIHALCEVVDRLVTGAQGP